MQRTQQQLTDGPNWGKTCYFAVMRGASFKTRNLSDTLSYFPLYRVLFGWFWDNNWKKRNFLRVPIIDVQKLKRKFMFSIKSTDKLFCIAKWDNVTQLNLYYLWVFWVIFQGSRYWSTDYERAALRGSSGDGCVGGHAHHPEHPVEGRDFRSLWWDVNEVDFGW